MRRPAAVPVAVVRRHDPVQPAGLPVRGRVPERAAARAAVRRPRSRACPSAPSSTRSSTPAATARSRRSRWTNQYAPIHIDGAGDPAREDDPRRDLRRARRRACRGTPWLRDGGMLARSQVVARGPARRCLQRARRADAGGVPAVAAGARAGGARERPEPQRRCSATCRRSPPTRPTSCACSTSSTPPSCGCRSTAAPCSTALTRNQAALRNLITTARDDVRDHRCEQQRARRDVPATSRRSSIRRRRR